MSKEAVLGCGLISIGRPWGQTPSEVPTESEAIAFLTKAYELGITFFDTAPSYGGLSEQKLGLFLKSLSSEERDRLTVATKFGEHWNSETNQAYADHSYEALRRSLDQSLQVLGRIDILQLHKTNPQVLQSEDFNRALKYARSLGIRTLGASVSDLPSAEIACSNPELDVIQLPYNRENSKFQPILALAKDKLVITNRPFAMGALTSQAVEAYSFILKARRVNLVVLTGTKNPDHLKDNISAFNTALSLPFPRV